MHNDKERKLRTPQQIIIIGEQYRDVGCDVHSPYVRREEWQTTGVCLQQRQIEAMDWRWQRIEKG